MPRQRRDLKQPGAKPRVHNRTKDSPIGAALQTRIE
jgi:hypothetical protein